MAEYIEREKALDFISEVEPIICMPPNNKPTFTAVKDSDMVAYLESIPAADVRPVVRGEWVQDCDYHFRCSVCGDRWAVSNGNPLDLSNGWNFCPNCGADMREES